MLKIGQIGIGHNHGEAKILAVRKRPDLFSVVGFAEEDEEWTKKRGGLRGYEGLPHLTVDEVIEQSDAVLVECDVWNLTKYAQRCIDAGKHIHMDKPASGTLAEYEKLLTDAKAKRLVVQLGYMYRYNPAVKMTLDAVKRGDLGEIYAVNAEMSTFHSKSYKEWLGNFEGGIHYILGSHLADLIVYMLGEPDRVTNFLKHTCLDGVDIPDNNLSVLEYGNTLARIYVSSVEVNGWGRRQLTVSGSKGTINIMPLENKTTMTWADLSVSTNPYEDMKREIDIPDVPKDCRYDEMMQDFYDYVMGTKENPFTYEHDLAVQRVIHKMIGKED